MKFETPVRVNAEDVKRLSKGLHEWFVQRYGESEKVSIQMVAWGGFLEVNAPAVIEFIKAYAVQTLRQEDLKEREVALQAINKIATTIFMGSEFSLESSENMWISNDSFSFMPDNQRVHLKADGCAASLQGHNSYLKMEESEHNIVVLAGNSQTLKFGETSKNNLIICIGNDNLIVGDNNSIILVGQNNEIQGANSVISFDTRARIFSFKA